MSGQNRRRRKSAQRIAETTKQEATIANSFISQEDQARILKRLNSRSKRQNQSGRPSRSVSALLAECEQIRLPEMPIKATSETDFGIYNPMSVPFLNRGQRTTNGMTVGEDWQNPLFLMDELFDVDLHPQQWLLRAVSILKDESRPLLARRMAKEVIACFGYEYRIGSKGPSRRWLAGFIAGRAFEKMLVATQESHARVGKATKAAQRRGRETREQKSSKEKAQQQDEVNNLVLNKGLGFRAACREVEEKHELSEDTLRRKLKNPNRAEKPQKGEGNSPK